MSVKVLLDFLPPTAASPNARVHEIGRWRARKALSEAVWLRRPGGPLSEDDALESPIDPARVTYHLKWCGTAPDKDNFIASMKGALDGLVDAGIVIDDSPDHIELGEPIYERVPHRTDVGVTIEVEEVLAR